MPKLVPIVEGDGEVNALPILIRRLLQEVFQDYSWQVLSPHNAKGCANLTIPHGIERLVQRVVQAGPCDAILVLLDCDAAESLFKSKILKHRDCPYHLAQHLAERIQRTAPPVSAVVTVAKWEYEVWLLASLEHITTNTKYSHLAQHPMPNDIEAIPSPKKWFKDRFPQRYPYAETFDQAKMTALIDIPTVYARSRSFRRLQHAIEQLREAHEQATLIVTPL